MVDINSAFSAYNMALKRANSAIESGGKIENLVKTNEEPGSASPFANMVKNTISEAEKTNRNAEELTMQAIAGEADMREVVLAVQNAETTLQTVIALRDKIVAAYQEILRMPM